MHDRVFSIWTRILKLMNNFTTIWTCTLIWFQTFSNYMGNILLDMDIIFIICAYYLYFTSIIMGTNWRTVWYFLISKLCGCVRNTK
jgi:hypothetical protein